MDILDVFLNQKSEEMFHKNNLENAIALTELELQLLNIGNVINSIANVLIKKGFCTEDELKDEMIANYESDDVKPTALKLQAILRIAKKVQEIIEDPENTEVTDEDKEFIVENASKYFTEDQAEKIVSMFKEK